MEIPSAPEQADAVAAMALEHARNHGWTVLLRTDTALVPDEAFGGLAWRGTWADIDELLQRLRDNGAGWVSLRFALQDDGTALVRYEARPDGPPSDDPRLPGVTGGFDCQRLMSHEEFRRLHRSR